jgi:hypothetical protein
MSILFLFGVVLFYLFGALVLVYDYKPKYSGVLSISISFMLGFAAMEIFDDYTFRKGLEVYESSIVTVCFITLLIATLGVTLFLSSEIRKNNIEQKKIHEEYRAKEIIKQKEEIKKYGRPTKTIEPYGYDSHLPRARIFNKSSIIEVNGQKIKFSDILEYGVHEDVNSELHMSKPSMIRRGVVGGLLYREVGAYVGAATAEQYIETKVNYTIYIRLINGQVKKVFTEDIGFLDDLCSELDFIICQNSSNS